MKGKLKQPARIRQDISRKISTFNEDDFAFGRLTVIGELHKKSKTGKSTGLGLKEMHQAY